MKEERVAEERRKERMRETGDKVEGRTMEEESALLVTGRKALMPKSFGSIVKKTSVILKEIGYGISAVISGISAVTPRPPR